jgi:hypothetical protein
MKCPKCPKYNECKKPCQDIEKQMRDEGIYSRDYIRPHLSTNLRKKDKPNKWREIPFSALNNNDWDILRPILGDEAKKYGLKDEK